MDHKASSSSVVGSHITPPPPVYRSAQTSVASSSRSASTIGPKSRATSVALPRYASHDPILDKHRKHSIYTRDFAPDFSSYRFDRKASVAFERAEQNERLPPMDSIGGRRPSYVPRSSTVRPPIDGPRHTEAQLRRRNILFSSVAAFILLIVFVYAYKRIEQDCKGQVDKDFCKWGGWAEDRAVNH